MTEAAGKSIFVIDDDPTIRALYDVILSDAGYEITSFHSADDALARIPALPRPALMLVDFSLPQMDGETLVRKLRHKLPDLSERTCIGGFSSFPAGSAVTAGFETIVDFYAEKPSDIDLLERLATDAIAAFSRR